MFFRRHKAVVTTFDQRVGTLKGLGFTCESDGKGGQRVTRGGYAAIVREVEGQTVSEKAGLLIGSEIAHLVSAGYQMFFRTASGVLRPAQADQLKALHEFTEDLKEALGETSLYNESLGTTTETHLYDRVEDRDHGSGHHAWDK